MDRRSWLWRRKSSEKSPGETESSGSVSSHSERYSDDQEPFRVSSNNASPNHAQSPEVSANSTGEVNEKVKSLTEKLSTALLNIKVKEDLVKQHAKVAEEAVSGWEKAETEVAALKQQLEDATQKNSALENRISHLDGALKECVRQLRQSREEQEERIHDALAKKTREWESEKFELETRFVELQAQLEVTKAKVFIPADADLRSKLEALEKENSSLKVELLAQLEKLQTETLERELSTQAAETASKQHLESIKKVAKLEAECRRLKAAARKTSTNDRRLVPSVAYAESLTDSQSDTGERLLGVENEQSCSDSWASALIAELDQFKHEKAVTRNLATSAGIDLMDDFLEMERLAALPEADCGNSSFEFEAGSDQTQTRDGIPKAELEIVQRRVVELEEKVEQLANEKANLETALIKTQNEHNNSSNQLNMAQERIIELQKQLDLAYEAKHTIEIEVEPMEEKRKALESQLESSNLEVGRLLEKVSLLEQKIEDERVLSTKFAAKCCDVEALEENRKALQSQLESSHEEVVRLSEKVLILQAKVDEDALISAELAAKCQDLEAMESKKKKLDIQLKIARVEVSALCEKMRLLEMEVNEKRASSAELAANIEALEAQKKALESQLEFTNTEVHMLLEKVSLLERKVEEERALSAELAGKIKASDTMKKALESQLESANLEVRNLLEKVGLLERNIEDKVSLSAEFAANKEALEAKNKALESQLKSASFEVENLHEKAALLEMKFDNERAVTAELAVNAETFGAKKMEFESQLESANLEVKKLHEKIAFLEIEVQNERALSAELAAKIEVSDANKLALEAQLKSANTEVERLHEKVGLLDRKADKQMVLSAEFAAEDKVARKRSELDFRWNADLNGELKLRQEKELAVAVAAGKLVECQKTIASLSQQLKSLTDIDDFILEAEKPELDVDLLDLKRENMSTISALSNGKETDFPRFESSLSLVSDYAMS